jgi:hypothetical protein
MGDRGGGDLGAALRCVVLSDYGPRFILYASSYLGEGITLVGCVLCSSRFGPLARTPGWCGAWLGWGSGVESQ